MTHLYITDNGSLIGLEGGRFVIHQKKNLIKSIPKESIESISIFGNSTMTTPCMQEILISNIPVCFFSGKGRYYGRLVSTSGDKVSLLRQQFRVTEDESFTQHFSKKIISAKIHNQQVVICRYLGERKKECIQELSVIGRMEQKVNLAAEIDEIMGYEGYASRVYFDLLNKVIRPEFRFNGRSRRPPKDPFNALLSLGYTLILYEIMAKIEKNGLNAYSGFLHYDHDGSPALVEDLMEEWRAVIVDSLVMSMIQGNEVNYDDFIFDKESAGVYLTNDALRKFLKKFEKKISTKNKYLSYSNKEYSFRQAMDIQCQKIKQMITQEDMNAYIPIRIR